MLIRIYTQSQLPNLWCVLQLQLHYSPLQSKMENNRHWTLSTALEGEVRAVRGILFVFCRVGFFPSVRCLPLGTRKKLKKESFYK